MIRFKIFFRYKKSPTPLKTNMDTQNDGLEKVAPFKYGHSWYPFVRFLDHRQPGAHLREGVGLSCAGPVHRVSHGKIHRFDGVFLGKDEGFPWLC